MCHGSYLSRRPECSWPCKPPRAAPAWSVPSGLPSVRGGKSFEQSEPATIGRQIPARRFRAVDTRPADHLPPRAVTKPRRSSSQPPHCRQSFSSANTERRRSAKAWALGTGREPLARVCWTRLTVVPRLPRRTPRALTAASTALVRSGSCALGLCDQCHEADHQPLACGMSAATNSTPAFCSRAGNEHRAKAGRAWRSPTWRHRPGRPRELCSTGRLSSCLPLSTSTCSSTSSSCHR